MEKILSALDEIEKIANAYGVSNDNVHHVKEKAISAKVCTPIIGKFSSGKSALVNTVLGYNRKILKEDITPETAIPAEIVYTDTEDCIEIITNDDEVRTISVDEYRNYVADATTVKCARIHLRNSFLEQIPDVMIVDMPGFESGFDIHNKAIDNYLPQSLAYIVAFPADDMIVRSSVGNILKELCLHDMPLCVVITKYDKKNDDFNDTFEKMKESLRRFVGDRAIVYCRTSSFTGDAEELEDFLKEVQEKSQTILANSFIKSLLVIIDDIENYLKMTLNNSQLSESELDEEEEKLKKQLSGLNSQFNKEQENFDMEISECIEEIKNDVQCAMEGEESTLIAMAMNNQSINEHLNNVVRNTVTVSVKKRFIPKVEKYLKRVANCINGDSIGDVHISFSFNAEAVSKGVVSSTVAAVAAVIVAGPIIGGIIAGVIAFVNKIQKDKKREEVKHEIRTKLHSEVFPQVMREVGNSLEMTITKQIKLINSNIEEELQSQKETLEKAMADVRGQINDEKARKENLATDIKNDLERLGEIRNGL